MLPLSLQQRIQHLLASGQAKPSLIQARKQLTHRYRSPLPQQGGFVTSSEALAYVACRLPATFAAVEATLPHVPLRDVSSVLDLGAGPGTATLAAALHWPKCQRFHLIEGDAFMSDLSDQLFKDMPEIAHQIFSYEKNNLLTVSLDTSYDLVLLSYVLNELSSDNQEKVLKKAWAVAEKGLVIVMPGTPKEYQKLMILRDLLIKEDAFIAAPCPHHNACPLEASDWCHFSIRLARPSFHRDIKDVSLPYEDEKFSYLVALRQPNSPSIARVIRKPLHRSGHVTLDLCTKEGLKRMTLSRRDKERYKRATKLMWGDDWKEGA